MLGEGKTHYTLTCVIEQYFYLIHMQRQSRLWNQINTTNLTKKYSDPRFPLKSLEIQRMYPKTPVFNHYFKQNIWKWKNNSCNRELPANMWIEEDPYM